MARFEREAQVLASLNHPNIAAIYGLEESSDVRALAMELGTDRRSPTELRKGRCRTSLIRISGDQFSTPE